MASSKEYLQYVLEQLSGLGGVSARAMMGEYLLYCEGKLIGGVYDDRLLLKPTKTAIRILEASSGGAQTDIPYPGAKPMLVADVDDRELTVRVLRAALEELPEPKRK